MFSGCVCVMFIVIIGGLISQDIHTKNIAIKKDIYLTGSLESQLSKKVPIKAMLHGYFLNIWFLKTVDSVSIYVKNEITIVDLYEVAVIPGEKVEIDLSTFESGEYRLDMHDVSNNHVYGFFFIE